MTWRKEHPGVALDLNFNYMARRADAVETGRSTLRAYALISEVVYTMKRLAIKQESETAQETGTGSTDVLQPSTKAARVEPVIRPLGMPLMPPGQARASASSDPLTPAGRSVVILPCQCLHDL